MRDYTGDMDYFQYQLEKVGISRNELDMCDFIGLTKSELQNIVDKAIEWKKSQKGN